MNTQINFIRNQRRQYFLNIDPLMGWKKHWEKNLKGNDPFWQTDKQNYSRLIRWQFFFHYECVEYYFEKKSGMHCKIKLWFLAREMSVAKTMKRCYDGLDEAFILFIHESFWRKMHFEFILISCKRNRKPFSWLDCMLQIGSDFLWKVVSKHASLIWYYIAVSVTWISITDW